MEKFERQNLLYDFYGELLTDHQKSIYERVILEDLSYSEIAKEEDISRQGIYDLVKRCDNILEGYEEKLKLVEKFEKTKQNVKKMNECAESIHLDRLSDADKDQIQKIVHLSNQILEEY